MSSGVKVMDDTCRCTKWYWGHGILSSSVGIIGTCVKKVSESASASLSASLISFERQSSSYKVIRARILASCANISRRKGALSPLGGSFFNDLSNRTSFYFPLSSGGDGTEAWTGAVAPNVVRYCVSSGVWSYRRMYGFLDQMPTGCEVVGCVIKASFSSSESLSEAIVTTSSSVVREMALHDLPLSLGLLDSHCLSLTIPGGPINLSRFCRHWNEALGFLHFCHWVDNIQSGFRY